MKEETRSEKKKRVQKIFDAGPTASDSSCDDENIETFPVVEISTSPFIGLAVTSSLSNIRSH